MNIYEQCPELESERCKLRLVTADDLDDLLKVYSDKEAVQFFNSDNCNGDDFYYTTPERMKQAIDFWLYSYKHGYFVRFSIIDKKNLSVIGTIEIFNRIADDFFTNCGLFRLDLLSSYENRNTVGDIIALVTEPIFCWFDCNMIATKAVPSANERIPALKAHGFEPTAEKLIGTHDHKEYDNYYVLKKQEK